MSDEFALAAKAALEPAAQEFAAAIGRSGPGSEVMTWLGDMIRYRRLPHQAKLLKSAAEKIRASGLPTTAVSDKLLRAVLEDGGFEDDDDMQAHWANLLAGAATGGSVLACFPEILRQLEPIEARALDALVGRQPALHTSSTMSLQHTHGLQPEHVDNLERLGLIIFKVEWDPRKASLERPTQLGRPRSGDATIWVSPLAVALVKACRPPGT